MCTTALIIKEMKIKITVKCHLTLVSMVNIKKKITTVDKNLEKREHL